MPIPLRSLRIRAPRGRLLAAAVAAAGLAHQLPCSFLAAKKTSHKGLLAVADAHAELQLEAASPAASTANLAKTIIGSGVLALPAGAAQLQTAAADAGLDPNLALAAAVLLLLFFGAVNARGFYLVGAVCAATRSRTYQEAWRRTLGPTWEWMPSAASLVCSLTGCVACATVIGDTAAELFASTFPGDVSRDALLWAISATVLLPLSLLPSLAPLAFASVLGILGVLLLAAVMVFRCFDGSYQPGGLYEAVALQLAPGGAAAPEGEIAYQNLLGQSFLFVALLSNAFSAHFNAPTIFAELQGEPTTEGAMQQKLSSFNVITVAAFGFSAALFLVVMFASLTTFGTFVHPVVLNGYAISDPLAAVARVGLVCCVLFEFPLLERCFRSTAAELLGLSPDKAVQPVVALASVASMIALACMPGLGFLKVSAVGGALGSSLLTYVAPSIMILRLRENDPQTVEQAATEAGPSKNMFTEAEAALLRSTAAFGATLGGLGFAEAAGIAPSS